MTTAHTAALLTDVSSAYEEGIVDAGKQPELFGLLAFLLTFAIVRTITHGIRSGARWWPGNLDVGGTHIHHLVWGILLLLVVGYVGVMLEPPSPWHDILGVLFGVGAALTLDEFALWLNLRDVYWASEGRRSIDAVIIAAMVGALGVLGFSVWVDLADRVATAAQLFVGSVGFLGIGLAIVNALKGKLYTGLVALLVPALGAVGALRLARPDSIWARRFYSEERRARAERRFPRRREAAAGDDARTAPDERRD